MNLSALMSGVKSVQRGIYNAYNATNTGNIITIAAVTMSKSLLLVDGYLIDGGNASININVSLSSATTIAINMAQEAAGYTTKNFAWQVVEYY